MRCSPRSTRPAPTWPWTSSRAWSRARGGRPLSHLPHPDDAPLRLAAAGLGVTVDTVLTDRAWLRDMVDQWAAHRAVLIGVRFVLPELERRDRARGDRSLGNAKAQLALVPQ